MIHLKRYLRDLRDTASISWREVDSSIKFRLVIVFVVVLASSALGAFSPVLLKYIVDGFSQENNELLFPPITFVVLYVLSQWLMRALGEMRRITYAHVERRMYRSISSRLFEQIMKLPLKFHLERKTGAFSQIMNNGLQGYQLILQHIIFTFLPAAIELTTVVLILMHFGHSLFMAIFMLSLVCYSGIFFHGVVKVAGPSRDVSSANIEANALLTDSILNYETVKYFGTEGVIRRRFDDALARTESEWLRFFRAQTTNGLGVATVFAVFLGVALLYATLQVKKGAMTTGDFVLLSTYMFMVVRPVEALGMAFQQLSQGFAFLEKMLELFREKTEEYDKDDRTGHVATGSVKFSDVSFSYVNRREVLRGVSFDLPAGKTLGVVGASGAGKSTLARLLVRFLEPVEGHIHLGGTPISDVSIASLRDAIAIVPQDTMLFNDTIRYNIGMGKPGCAPQEIEEAAKLAHLHEFIMGLPNKYDTEVGERGVKLSGGEKQRISIARAALRKPKIYIFDEATSSLDSQTEQLILQNIRELSRNCTAIIIAHRLSAVAHADQIIVLHKGMIAERGDHAGLLRMGGRYAQLWQAQQRVSIPSEDIDETRVWEDDNLGHPQYAS